MMPEKATWLIVALLLVCLDSARVQLSGQAAQAIIWISVFTGLFQSSHIF